MSSEGGFVVACVCVCVFQLRNEEIKIYFYQFTFLECGVIVTPGYWIYGDESTPFNHSYQRGVELMSEKVLQWGQLSVTINFDFCFSED